MCLNFISFQVLVGTTTGQLALFDFRQESRGLFRKYKGCVGSIRSLDCDRETGYFSAVGLDRFLHVYHVGDKKVRAKTYLKSRLNSVLLGRGFDPTSDCSKGNKDEEDEEEVLLLDADGKVDEAFDDAITSEPVVKKKKKRLNE